MDKIFAVEVRSDSVEIRGQFSEFVMLLKTNSGSLYTAMDWQFVCKLCATVHRTNFASILKLKWNYSYAKAG